MISSTVTLPISFNSICVFNPFCIDRLVIFWDDVLELTIFHKLIVNYIKIRHEISVRHFLSWRKPRHQRQPMHCSINERRKKLSTTSEFLIFKQIDISRWTLFHFRKRHEHWAHAMDLMWLNRIQYLGGTAVAP